MVRIYVFIFIVGTLGSVAWGAKWYYEDTQARLTQLRENNVKLVDAAETLQTTVDQLEYDAEQSQLNVAELQKKLKKSEAGLDRLRKRFSEIDITRDALADPADLERRINRGADRLIQDIFKDTGGITADTPADGMPEEQSGTDSSNED
jgi:predicted nuclease with TOPRIM domain